MRAGRAPRVTLLLQEGVEPEALLGARGPLAALPGGAAVALMNTAVRGSHRPASAYLTIGAGSRAEARGGPPAASAYHPAERTTEAPSAEVYGRRVGRLPGEAWLVLPALPSLGGPSPDVPVALPDQPRPGALAEAIRRRGGRVGLLVAGKRPPGERLGALAAMDTLGVVAQGAFATPKGALEAACRLLTPCELLVIDLGRDGGPIDLPRFLPQLAARLDPRRDTLLAVVPAPLARGGIWDRLTPVLAWGRGMAPGALLSRTTRTEGLVANIDVAPTVLAWLDVPSPPLGGHRMRVRPWAKGKGPADLLAFSQQVTLNRQALLPVLGGLGLVAVLTLALMLGALAWPTPGRRGAARSALLALASSPLALLVVPAIRPASVTEYAAVTLACAAAIAVTANVTAGWTVRAGRPLPPLLILYLGTSAVLVGDIALGAKAIAASLLSDFPLAGFRFYGIGNEYAGLLVGMAAVGLAWSVEAIPGIRRLLPGSFLLIAALVGLPGLGANFGEALTAAAAFTVSLRLLASDRSLSWPRLLLGVTSLLLLVALFLFLFDAARPEEERTHIGQLVERLLDRENGGGAVLLAEVARRKLLMNLRLITAPITLSVFAAVVPLLLLGYHGTKRRLTALMAGRPAFRAGVVGALAGGVVGFLVNDSGIVVWGMVTAAVLAALLDGLLCVPQGNANGSPAGPGKPCE